MVRDVGYRVITGGLHPDHATIARFRARHEKALGGLFSQVPASNRGTISPQTNTAPTRIALKDEACARQFRPPL